MTWYTALMLLTIGFTLGSLVGLRQRDRDHLDLTNAVRRAHGLPEVDR